MNFSGVFLVALTLAGVANVNASPISSSHDLLTTVDGLELPKTRAVRSARTDELDDVLEEFDDLVDEQKLSEIHLAYLLHDQEFAAAYEFGQGPEYDNITVQANKIVDVQKLYEYLNEAGFDLYNKLHYDSNVSTEKTRRHTRGVNITGGMLGYIADLKAILPVDKIKALHQEKLKSSPAFAKFVEYYYAPRFKELVNSLRTNEAFQKISKYAAEHGLHLNAVLDYRSAAYGLDFSKVIQE